MKAFMDSASTRDYLEIHLTADEIEKLPVSGICSKFYFLNNGSQKKKMLDILILPEDISGFTPDPEWEQEEENYGKYF